MIKNIVVPGSKSYIQRALIVGACCRGISRIKKLNLCDDVLSTIDLLRQLGASIIVDKDNKIATIEKPIDFTITEKELYVGESGTLCRIIIPILCNCFKGKFTITGSKTILNRVMEDPMLDVFRNLDVDIATTNGKLPITIDTTNKVKQMNHEIYVLDGSKTSQYISGFIISTVYNNRRNKRRSAIEITKCNSIGYIDITLDVLRSFKQDLSIEDNVIMINGRTRLVPNYDYESPGDWSCAAAIYTAASIFNKSICIDNLDLSSSQPDSKIIEILHNIKYNYITEFPINISKCPDIFPYVAVAVAVSKTKTVINGIHVLYNKESNRAQAIYDEFNNLGISCYIDKKSDTLTIDNSNIDLSKIGNKVNYYGDHRIAMALIMIKSYYKQGFEYTDCLNKSYPDFIKDLNNIIYEK